MNQHRLLEARGVAQVGSLSILSWKLLIFDFIEKMLLKINLHGVLRSIALCSVHVKFTGIIVMAFGLLQLVTKISATPFLRAPNKKKRPLALLQ